MTAVEALLAAGASFLFLGITFIPLEKVFSAKAGQKIFRPNWILDLCFFGGQYLLWNALVVWALGYVNLWIGEVVPSSFRVAVAGQPWLLQAAAVLFFSDLLVYWGHRLQHSVDFLWRFHKVHHSIEHMDWLAAHREHPLDSLYTIGLINLPAMLLGFPLETLVGLIAFRGIWAIYIHSNVRLNTGPLKKIIGAPELHHWHHELNRKAGNYANLSPLMDILFGTYSCPKEEPKRIGLEEKLPENYLGHMLHPLLPEKVAKKAFPFREQNHASATDNTH